jgi:uncharacterized protein YukE
MLLVCAKYLLYPYLKFGDIGRQLSMATAMGVSMTGAQSQAADFSFGVDPAALKDVAAQLSSLHGDLQQAISAYHGGECTADDLGSPAMAKAFTGFDSDWADVLNVISQAMRQLIRTVQGAGQAYSAADAAISAAITRISGQGS